MPIPPILEIYVVWHPLDKQGASVARRIFGHFHSGPYAGLAGGAIEVYFRSAGWESSTSSPRPIPGVHGDTASGQVAQTLVVVPVLSAALRRAVAGEPTWHEYLRDIYGLPAERGRLVIPVRDELVDLTGSALEALTDMPQSVILRGTTQLAREIAQAIADKAYGLKDRPTKIFISHTREKGSEDEANQEIVSEIRLVLSETHLEDFFDAADLRPGDANWRARLKDEASRTALLMVRTDAYSSRKWTQQEVLAAKYHDMPVVALYSITEGETRGSYLLDHVPTAISQPGDRREGLRRALDKLVDDTLKVAVWRKQCEFLADLGLDWLPAHPPETLTMIRWLNENPADDQPIWVMHPDPPLTQPEQECLRELCQIAGRKGSVEFLTPRTYVARGGSFDDQT